MTYRPPKRLSKLAEAIIFPFILLGLLAVELIDWLCFSVTPKDPVEIMLIKATARGCLFWIVIGIIVIIIRIL